MFLKITSSNNDKYKYFKALKQKKTRNESGEFTVEGTKSVTDAVNSQFIVNAIAVSESFFDNEAFTYPKDTSLYVIRDSLFSALTSTETPQGIMAIIKMKSNDCFSLSKEKAYIYCDRIQDPGNLGTIIRTADAAGFGGVLLSDNCVDLYNPKTVRASMGSFFHIDIMENIGKDKLINFKSEDFLIVCGILSDNTIDYIKADLTKPIIIVVGNEANGIENDIISLSDINVKIPIAGEAESLNAAVAASILMYETNRQRRI